MRKLIGDDGDGGLERRDPPGRAVPDVAAVVVAVRASALLGHVPDVALDNVAGTHPVVVAAPEVAWNVVRVRRQSGGGVRRDPARVAVADVAIEM